MAVRVETLQVGMLQVNCYLVWAEEAGKALIIDPGGDACRIEQALNAAGLEPVGILLTHAHVDHISAVGALTARFDLPVWVHADDCGLYLSPNNALPPWLPAASNLPPPAAALPRAQGLAFDVIHTPGHTPGGVCYHFAAESMLFSGDTLFQQSIGRTDLPGGNMGALLESIAQTLLVLPPETRVLPGHGPETTIGMEKSGNPYVSSRW